MYTWEIKNFMDSHNWKITHDEFYHIMFTSPQLGGFKLNKIESISHSIVFWTNDGLSGEVWFDNYKK